MGKWHVIWCNDDGFHMRSFKEKSYLMNYLRTIVWENRKELLFDYKVIYGEEIYL